MKAKEIEKVYSDKVKLLLNDGWRISVSTGRGSQGEIAKTDLIKGDTVVRVKLESKFFCRGKVDCFIPDRVVLEVMVYSDVEESKRPFDSLDYLWDSWFEVVETYIWIKLADNWFVPYEEAWSIAKIREERRNRAVKAAEYNRVDMPADAAKYVLKRVRREKGMKTAGVGDIKVEKWYIKSCHGEGPGYYATVKGRTIKL